MSSLYKQRYIVSDDSNKCVINSNIMVAEKLNELAKTLPIDTTESEAEDGFQEGITAFTEEMPTEEDVKQKMDNAKDEAKTLLERAQITVESMKQKAMEEAEIIKEQAREEGYNQGILNGRQDAENELNAELQKLEEKEKQLLEDYQQKLEELEPKLVDVITKVFEKVFQVQFADKREILLYLIQNTILNIESSKEFQIRVCDENYKFLESHKQEIIERVGQNITIDFVSDTFMKENQCTIETDSGVFECGLGVQLENLIKALRSLSL